ncbi:hypothetical protein B0H10DRAFT_11295 [Mycena sp. CBHHK59/15]|nr:hypothetical protein B0H10DRAFT_11295 [Mycena sp. CBHHK59/15]
MAARLNNILASPHATLAPAVRSVTFMNALSPVQIRIPSTGRVQVKTLLEIVPRITQLHHIRSLALSDLPFNILSAFPKVERLTLVGIPAGLALLRLASHLPRLTHLMLKRVHAIPYRACALPSTAPVSKGAELRSLAVSGSSIGFLGWMGVLAPRIKALDIADFSYDELSHLTAYLHIVRSTLESLKLSFISGTDARGFSWDELAQALDLRTRVVVCVDFQDVEEEDDVDAQFLRTQFAEWDKRGMLEVRPVDDSQDTD